MVVYVLATSTEEGLIPPKVFDTKEKAQKELERIYNDCVKEQCYPIEFCEIDKKRNYFTIQYKDNHLYGYVFQVEVE